MERGRSYQKKRRVLLLARARGGKLLAKVVGSRLYTTEVICLTSDLLRSLSATCSCPMGGDCKHAVAVVLEYLEQLKAGKEVPGELPSLTGQSPEADDTGFEEHDLQHDSDVDEDDSAAASDAPLPPRKRSSRKAGKVDVTAYLRGLTEAELVELVTELAASSEEARRVLDTRVRLVASQVGDIVAAARAELRRVASGHGWRNSWRGQGHTPDYSAVTKYLNKLLAADQADAVLELGRELLRLGTDQVGQGDDEGETGMAISEALAPVWEALSQSSLLPRGAHSVGLWAVPGGRLRPV